MRVLDPSGQILFARDETEVGNRVGLKIAEAAMRETLIKSGYEVYRGELRNHYVFPLTQRGRVIGALHFSLEPGLVFGNLSELLGVDFWVFTSLSGEVLAKSSADLTDIFALDAININQSASQIIKTPDASYRVLGSLINDYAGEPIGYLTSFKDDTANLSQAFQTSMITLAIVIGWLLLVVLTTWMLLTRKFAPLLSLQKVSGEIERTGNLTLRINARGDDEIAKSAQSIDRVLMLMDDVFKNANTLLSEVAKGNFDVNHLILNEADYHGDMRAFAERLNQTIRSVMFTIQELETIAKAMGNGDFNARMNPEVKGEIKITIDKLASDLSVVVSQVNTVMDGVKQSDFSRKVTVEAKGELATLVTAINASIENLSAGFNDVVTAAQRMAKGDFSQPITSNYSYSMQEAKDAINQSMADLGKVMDQITISTDNMAQSIIDVASGTDSLNDRTQQQAASLQQSSAALEQTASQVRSNVNATAHALQIAKDEEGILQEANQAMQLTQQAMQGIKDASEQIQAITSLIDSISFQTNLLALNAAVEAARAGEHGRGFAVVAGEVRSLAGKSADAAKDIGHLIAKAVSAVDEGVVKVDEVNGYLETVTRETNKLREVIDTITLASEQQSQGIAEINQSVASIDGITQQNAALVEETHASVEQMQQVSKELQSLALKFTTQSRQNNLLRLH